MIDQHFVPKIRALLGTLEERSLLAADPRREASREELLDELRLQQEELRVAHDELRQSADELERATRVATAEMRHYRDVFELAPDPFFVTDREGKLLELNAAAVELVGTDLGTEPTFESLIHADDRGMARELLTAARDDAQRLRVRFKARTGRVARAGLRSARSTDGNEVLWMARIERGAAEPTPPPAERAVSTKQSDAQIARLTAELDVAERKVVTERMAREDADGRERLHRWTMAVVAHGLRLPVEHIRHWCAKTRDDSPELRALASDVIRRHADVQAEMVEDLLDVRRVADHELRTTFSAVDPSEAARFVATTFEPIAAEKGVTVAYRARATGTIPSDPVRLVQALSNLAWVAIELSSRDQEVLLEGDRDADGVTITVSWQGETLRPDRLDWDLTRLGDGQAPSDRVGMSCLVARRLVQLHGGRLRTLRAHAERQSLVATFPFSRTVSRPPQRSRP